jgi:hypothetical protein
MRHALILTAVLLMTAAGTAHAAAIKPPNLVPGALTAALDVERPGLAVYILVVRVDADRRVEESEERGNGARRQCPLPVG